MKLAYFRKSNKNFKDLISGSQDKLEKAGYKILGKLESKNLAEISITNPDLLTKILQENKDIYALLPSKLIIFKNNKDEVFVGLNHLPDDSADVATLVNEIAGVDKLKPKSIKLYSTTTCPYCKMEDKWLDENAIEHKMVLVDLDQKAAEEMVQKTGQMGVPVTEIEYEDSESEFIVGFDKPTLSSLLFVK